MKKFIFLISWIIAVSILNIENAYCQSGAKWSSNGNYFSNPNAKPVFGTLDSNDVIIISAGIERSRYTTDGIFQINNGTNLEITGDIISHLFSGSTGLVSYDINGKFHWVPYGNPNSVLFGDGTWGILPPDDDWLQITGSYNIYTFPERWVGIGIEPSVPLDVLGNVWFRGNLTVDSDADFGGKVTADTIQASTVNGTNGSLDFNGSSITNISSINAGSISADNLNVSYTMFDSLEVQDKIKVGSNSIVLESFAFPNGPDNHIYTTAGSGSLYLQSQSYNQNTIINANNDGFVGIGTSTPAKNIHIKGITYIPSPIKSTILRIEDQVQGTTIIRNVWWDMVASGVDEKLYINTEASDLAGEKNIMTLTEEGKVGIGTTEPEEKLHISNGNIRTDGQRMIINGFNGAKNFWFRTSGSEPSSVFMAFVGESDGNAEAVNIAPGGIAGIYVTDGNVGIGTTTPTLGKLQIDPGVADSDHGIVLKMGSGGTSARMFLYPDGSGDQNFIITRGHFEPANFNGISVDLYGKVGIATTCVPAYYKLAVNGKIICEELTVELENDNCWGDFAFDKNYKRMNWKEKQKYYLKNKHLPGILSAKQIQKDGLIVGETMSGITLNVEENRLDITDLFKMYYELKKEYAEIRKENKELKNENAYIKAELKLLK